MKIVATKVYLRRVAKLLTEEERHAAEDEIVENPLRWPVIAGTGGIRKARVARGSSGKRGGARIIYYIWTTADTLYLLTAYSKSRREDLTPADKRKLRSIVRSLQEDKNE